MKQYTLITGGASGLGLGLSKLFAKDGNNLFLISSNLNNLSAAKEQIEKEYNVEVHILALDLSNPQISQKLKNIQIRTKCILIILLTALDLVTSMILKIWI